MGKKFGTNQKAEEGKERKQKVADSKKKQQDEQLEKQEALKWAEGAKQNKKQEDELKKLEKLNAKKERERLLAEETAQLKSAKVKSNAKSEKVAARNQLKIESLSSSVEEYHASNIDDALLIMESSSGSIDNLASKGVEKHPERRMKAAFAAYEEREMPLLKKENPTLRLSQLREILMKMWKKAPENPFNQAHASYDVHKEKEKQYIKEQVESKLESLKVK